MVIGPVNHASLDDPDFAFIILRERVKQARKTYPKYAQLNYNLLTPLTPKLTVD